MPINFIKGQKHSPYGLKNKAGRLLWNCVWLLLFRPSPKLFYGWRRFLLRLFGAHISSDAIVHPSVKVWAPWNLKMKKGTTLAPYVNCYCTASVILNENTIVSQYSFLCTATHDYETQGRPVVSKPIIIEAGVWICADVFIAPGVTIGEGVIVGARAAVFKNIEPWTVVGGNPAKFIKRREIKGI